MKRTSAILISIIAIIPASKVQAQLTFGSWTGTNWSGAGHSSTITAGVAGGIGTTQNLTYNGALASFNPVPTKTFGPTAGVVGTVLSISVSEGMAGNMSLLFDRMAIGGGYAYSLVAFDVTNAPVSLAGVTRTLTDYHDPSLIDELTLSGATGQFGLFDVPGGTGFITGASLFTNFSPTIRRFEVTTPGTISGNGIFLGIQAQPAQAVLPEPAAIAFLLLGGAGLFTRRRCFQRQL